MTFVVIVASRVNGRIKEQSDMGLHCLTNRLLLHFSIRQQQPTLTVIGILRANGRIKN